MPNDDSSVIDDTKVRRSLRLTWQRMKDRCSNPKAIYYFNYGGRGIKVCQQWLTDFEAFAEHVGPKPSRAHSIDRIDNNKGYEPGNVKWATKLEQVHNQRSNINITISGETKCLAEWAREHDMSITTLWSRIFKLGWDGARAIQTPVKGRRFTLAKVTPRTIRRIRRLSAGGMDSKAIGKKLGVSHSIAWNIVSGKTFWYVK